jgi:hypothetical protein
MHPKLVAAIRRRKQLLLQDVQKAQSSLDGRRWKAADASRSLISRCGFGIVGCMSGS